MRSVISRVTALVLWGGLGVTVAGCGPTNSRLPVTGEVSYNGTPLPDGTIKFESLPGEPQCVEGSMIENGKFSIAGKDGLLPGKYRVEVSAAAPQKAGAEPDNRGNPKEMLPDHYNTKSELKAEVTDPGPNTFTFTLAK